MPDSERQINKDNPTIIIQSLYIALDYREGKLINNGKKTKFI
jgi:hypothetical protein